MSAPLLELHGLSAGYTRVVVVRDLSMRVLPGEVVALLGPNGAGKTATLLTIAGVLRPASGEVLLHGSSVARLPAHRIARSGIALVPQGRALFAGLTVRQNLVVGHRRSSNHELDELVAELPSLERLMHRRCELLSGGEQQLVAIARALMGRPDLLMIDEMTLGLAPLVVDRLLTMIRHVSLSRGIGVLLVEQHVHQALSIANRAYVLRQGQLVMEGTAGEVRADLDELQRRYFGAPSRRPVHPAIPKENP